MSHLVKKMNLKLVPGFQLYKNIKHADDEKFICVSLCHWSTSELTHIVSGGALTTTHFLSCHQ